MTQNKKMFNFKIFFNVKKIKFKKSKAYKI